MFVCLLACLRLYLAHAIAGRVKAHLTGMQGYKGRIDGIGISLWRGAYQIEGLKITKDEGSGQIPFFQAPVIDIGPQWNAVLKGHLAARVVVVDGRLNFVNGPSDKQSQIGAGVDWLPILAGLAPVEIDQFRLRGGEVRFTDPYGKPAVDLQMRQVYLEAGDLFAKPDAGDPTPASITATARIMDDALFILHAGFDPQAPAPTFDYHAELDGLQLMALNPLFQRYEGVQVLSGSADIHSEGVGGKGSYGGYIQPTIVSLKMTKSGFHPEGILRRALLRLLVWAFTDGGNKVEKKFDYSGRFQDPGTSIWTAPAYIFEHGFAKAMPHGLAGAAMMEGLQRKAQR
jgi:Domain of Unknown Function (DUF748)